MPNIGKNQMSKNPYLSASCSEIRGCPGHLPSTGAAQVQENEEMGVGSAYLPP